MMLQVPPSYYNKVSESSLRKVGSKSVLHPPPVKTQSSVGSHSTPHAPRVKKPVFPPPPHINSPEVSTPQSAWEDGVWIQPFRRTQCKQPPTGVPTLDLTRFNEPDALMEPVRVRVPMATERSRLSWGCGPAVRQMEQLASDLCIEDVPEDSPEAMPSETTPTDQHNSSLLEETQARFIEDKLLSNERSQPQPPVNGVLPRHPAAKPGVMVPESSLSKKLRFEARVLTQNGRDVHRELCGFFFLVDGSITVYEFRQFGKKSSALPLIRRGVYKHLVGAKRGELYEVNFIKKGSIIHFHTADHPGLPTTLATRPVLALKITYVDEMAKKQLLIEGKNPLEVRQVELYLTGSEVGSRECQVYTTLQGLLASRLHGRASKTLVGLGRQLAALGDSVTKGQLQHCLRNYHISLTVEDMDQLWRLIYSEQNDGHHDNTSDRDDGSVPVDGLISCLVGPLKEDRLLWIRKVFRKLDSLKTGAIGMEVLHRFFAAFQHPSVLDGQRSPDDVWLSVSSILFPHGRDSTVTYADFEHYYHGVSIETVKDSDFQTLLKNCWTL